MTSTTNRICQLCLLRVEGLNFRWAIDDTHDLSTIAGGSQLLAKLPEAVEKRLQAAQGVIAMCAIQKAASVGLFVFCAEAAAVSGIVNDLRTFVSTGKFVDISVAVEAITLGHDVTGDDAPTESAMARAIEPKHRKALEAAVRHWQMQAPTVPIPECMDNAVGPCADDRVRPALAPRTTINPRKPTLSRSPSVQRRRQLGLDYRFHGTVEFARTFDELTIGYTERLNGRLAVIKIDGKGFGGLTRTLDGEQFRMFSHELGKQQKAFEAELLAAWAAGAANKRYYFERKQSDDGETLPVSTNVLRFQRLVTAGDDATYLMPAWLAWEFLEKFFGRDWKAGGHLLHFRAGVVLCHHNAPIHRVRALAERLEELPKKVAPDVEDPIAYEVLKSFDLAEPDIESYRDRRRPTSLTRADMIIEGRKISDLLKTMKDSQTTVSMGIVKDPGRWKDKPNHAALYHLSQWHDLLDRELL